MIFSLSPCRRCTRAATCAVALLLLPRLSEAADTVETFDLGASDMELYAGFDGIGAPKSHRGLGVETLMGFGITAGFSSYLAASLTADPTLSDGEAAVAGGIFGTPVDKERFKLDLILELGADGENLSTLHVVPMTELNFDFEGFGFYLRTGADIYGSLSDEEVDGSPPVSADWLYTPGAYVNIGERHQLLLEYHGALHFSDGAEIDRGAFALGWNVVLGERIELINEVSLTLPDGAETPVSAGLYVGLIASIGSQSPTTEKIVAQK